MERKASFCFHQEGELEVLQQTIVIIIIIILKTAQRIGVVDENPDVVSS